VRRSLFKNDDSCSVLFYVAENLQLWKGIQTHFTIFISTSYFKMPLIRIIFLPLFFLFFSIFQDCFPFLNIFCLLKLFSTQFQLLKCFAKVKIWDKKGKKKCKVARRTRKMQIIRSKKGRLWRSEEETSLFSYLWC
jgi:hypothetical protein